jgi:hypothetical protein
VHEADLHIKKQLPDEKSPYELFRAIESTRISAGTGIPSNIARRKTENHVQDDK